jgi:DNA (cytosine-5)-methyltransferase 1
MNVYLIDLFCGAGGFSTGAQLAGAIPILAVDSWRPALDIHKKNHPNCVHLCVQLGGCLDEFASFIIGFIDLYVPRGSNIHIHASPPCQLLSAINPGRDYMRGMELVFWTLDVIKMIQPHTWSLEQVANRVLLSSLKDKYDASISIIRMPEYGIPNCRKRLVMGRGFQISEMEKELAPSMSVVFDSVGFTPPDEFQFQADGTRNGEGRKKVNMRSTSLVSYTVTQSHPRLCNASGKNMMIPIDAYAALQTFHTNYFDGDCPVSQIRKMIGNAVPPHFAEKLMGTVSKL